MSYYAAFGGILRSPIEFPELAAIGDPPGSAPSPDWTLEVSDKAASLSHATSLGVDEVYANCKVRAYRRPSGLALAFDDTGVFEVASDGRRIVWHQTLDRFPIPDQFLAAGRSDVLGRVLPLALHLSGVLSLHASAVVIGGEAIAFLAPKFHGKSTLASALLEQDGARLITDDVLPVRVSEPPDCLPGVPRLRLWRDAAQAVLGAKVAMDAADDVKLLVDAPKAGLTQQSPVRLAAIYFLTPVSQLPDGKIVHREPLDSIATTLGLVQHAKLGPLLTGADAGQVFSQAASIAAAVPGYDLYVVRNLEQLREGARTIASWHAPVPSTV